jgi:dephospho-CoA kinase
MNLKAVLAITAKPGAGKATFACLTREILRENGIYTNPTIMEFGTNGILGKMAKYLNILPSRPNLQKLPQLLKENFPGWTLAKMMEKQILEDEFSELIIVDGVRWLEDEQMVRELPVPSFILYVQAAPELRWQRMRQRNERPGEGELAWEDFLKQDSAPTEVNIEQIGSRADYQIDNNGTEEEYKNQVRKIIAEKIVPLFRKQETPQ